MSTTRRKRSSSTDDKTEAIRKIIRRSLDEIIVAVEQVMQRENPRSRIQIVVPSRHSLVTIAGPSYSSSEEWARLSSIVCEVIGTEAGQGRITRSGIGSRHGDCEVERRRRGS